MKDEKRSEQIERSLKTLHLDGLISDAALDLFMRGVKFADENPVEYSPAFIKALSKRMAEIIIRFGEIVRNATLNAVKQAEDLEAVANLSVKDLLEDMTFKTTGVSRNVNFPEDELIELIITNLKK